MQQSPFREPNQSSASQEIPLIATFTTAHHLYPSWATQSSSYLPDITSQRFILILSPHEVSFITNNKHLNPKTFH
jgi:hypothetical protein